jgi:hypothetical protein
VERPALSYPIGRTRPLNSWAVNYVVGETAAPRRADALTPRRGVVINGISSSDDLSTVTTATGGFTAFVSYPIQYPIVSSLLPQLLLRDLPFHRLHIDLHAYAGGTFAAGETVVGYLALQIRLDTRLW